MAVAWIVFLIVFFGGLVWLGSNTGSEHAEH